MTTLTRRYRFAASHRLHVHSMSDDANIALFGKCNNPFGHGHDYVLSVTVAGPVDSRTGLIISPAALDGMVEESVLQRLAHRNLNLDLPEFAELVPTTENVVMVIAGLLAKQWPLRFKGEKAVLAGVHVQETDRNGFEVRLRNPRRPSFVSGQQESVSLNA